MNRREFLRFGAGIAAASALPTVSFAADDVPEFARGAKDMGPVLGRAELRRKARARGKY